MSSESCDVLGKYVLRQPVLFGEHDILEPGKILLGCIIKVWA